MTYRQACNRSWGRRGDRACSRRRRPVGHPSCPCYTRCWRRTASCRRAGHSAGLSTCETPSTGGRTNSSRPPQQAALADTGLGDISAWRDSRCLTHSPGQPQLIQPRLTLPRLSLTRGSARPHRTGDRAFWRSSLSRTGNAGCWWLRRRRSRAGGRARRTSSSALTASWWPLGA